MERAITYVIGDVHGCLDPLKMAINIIEHHSNKDVEALVRLVFVGDLIDKGPNSIGVLRYVQDLAGLPQYEVVVVMGNHEEKLLRYLPKIENAPDYIKEIAAQLTEGDIEFLKAMPLVYRIPGHNVTVVHGGVLPKHEKIDGQMSKKEKNLLAHVNRVRYIRGEDQPYQETRYYDADGKRIGKHKSTDDGPMPAIPEGGRIEVVDKINLKDEFIPLGEEGPNDVFWAERYDGRFGQIFFGHQPFNAENCPQFKHAVALDLGCVLGGHLAVAKITSTEGDYLDKSIRTKKHADSIPGTGFN